VVYEFFGLPRCQRSQWVYAMTEAQFWAILKAAFRRRGKEHPGFHCKEWFNALKGELARLPPEEILLFEKYFDEKVWTADTVDLLGVHLLINGGSDDSFHHFRCWLVGMGKKVYQNALRDADSLANVLDGQWPIEATLDGAARDVWEQKTGRTKFDEFGDALQALNVRRLREDQGKDWDVEDEDELHRRLPRLSELYGGGGEEGSE
jgi:Protein of unknown function (DUF4240)